MAVIFEFMSAFRYAAGLVRKFESEHLESALIRSPGGPGLLADVHIVSPLAHAAHCNCLQARSAVLHASFPIYAAVHVAVQPA